MYMYISSKEMQVPKLVYVYSFTRDRARRQSTVIKAVWGPTCFDAIVGV